MDRLTYWQPPKENAYLKRGLDNIWGKKLKGHGYEIIVNAINRLAAYEDTGLKPDEIPQWIPISKPPKNPGNYLVWRNGHGRPDVMRWNKNTGFNDRKWQAYGRVIYWASLIEPPKEKN